MATEFFVRLSDVIYTEAFGIGYHDLIAQAKGRAGDKWDYIGWDDDEEAMKDCLNIKALEALNAIDRKLMQRMYPGMTEKTMLQVAKYVASQHRVDNIWYKA